MSTEGRRQRSLARVVHNRNLFADRYLLSDERLRALPEWRDRDGLAEAFEAIRTLWQDHAAGFDDRTNEAQTEEDFIKPVLHVLGWAYEVQEGIANVNKRPDYALFASEEARSEAQPDKGSPEFWKHVDAVGDAKRWDLDLDRGRADGNPSTQISNYLYRSGVRWGILTNGRKWRLYEQDTARGGDAYYEVDLVDILGMDDRQAFRYFYLFFRRGALVPGRDGRTFLQLVFEESERYRAEVGDSLKEAVYDALRTLMDGFLAHPDNAMDASDPVALQRVHDISLIVLYRLLFLFYAEDNGLLPAREQPYEDYSMLTLQGTVNMRLRLRRPYSRVARGLWQRLLGTCELIDEGLPEGDEWVIPAYNGGLFSCKRYPEISHESRAVGERWEIGDYYLAPAVDLLAYRRKRWDTPGADDVDYATLDVQHLGSIYEGLLELQPVVADEPMIEQSSPRGPVVIRRSEVEEPEDVDGAPPREFDTGEVYLVTDRGERKATGSYYTPAYIVDYIVEHTVGELAKQAAEDVGQRWDELREELGCDEVEEIDGLIEAADSGDARQRLEEKKRSLLEPYLSLKVLDPAMGSGHFLVGAADYLSFAMATDPRLPPVPSDEADSPQAYYKRLVVQHCLFGVDLNQLAVELAKVSLWMHTVSRDKALSFLDHHLRWGNSLIGARLEEDLRQAPPPVSGGRQGDSGLQIELDFDAVIQRNDLVAFLDVFQRIVDAPAGDADVERQKDAWYREMDGQRDPYRAVANLWLAPYFGVEVSPERYGQAVDALRSGRGNAEWREVEAAEWFCEAQAIAARRDRRFFHWELEFPEAFFEVAQGKAKRKPAAERGFNAVIGNPPWANAWSMTASDAVGRDAISACCSQPKCLTGHWDLYVPFTVQALWLAKSDGLHAFIVPDAIGTEKYGATLRAWLLQDCALLQWVHFAGTNVFAEVSRHPVIYISARRKRKSDYDIPCFIGSTDGEAFQAVGAIHSATCLATLNSVIRVPTHSGAVDIYARLVGQSLTVGQFCYVMVGATTHAKDKVSFVKSDVVTIEPRGNAQRFFDGKSLARYDLRWDGRYIDYRENEMYGPRVPELFDAPKVIVRDVTGPFSQLVASYDDEGLYCDHLITCMTYYENLEGTGTQQSFDGHDRVSPPYPHLTYVLGIISGRMMSWVFGEHFATDTLQGNYSHTYPRQIREFPIRVIDFGHATDEGEKGRLLAECREAIEGGDYETPYVLARTALAAHAAAHGPAGKLELREDEYWRAEIEWLESAGGGARRPEDLREDFVHDLLAELAQRMMDLSTRKHALVTDFEADLRGQSDAETAEDLRKGKQQRTLFRQEACRPFVEEGSHSTCSLSDSLGWSEEAFEAFVRELAGGVRNLSDLLRIYDVYADDYRHLSDGLRATDALIDRVVYALYGLGPDEIAIIEESLT